jgi:hypothetical protein
LGTVAGFVSFYSALGNFVEPHSLSRDYSESIEYLKLADSVAKAILRHWDSNSPGRRRDD